MRDGSLERRFVARALHVNVDPLVIERGVGELLNALLGYIEPVGDGDLLADEVFEGVGRIEDAFGHKNQNLPRSHGELPKLPKIAEIEPTYRRLARIIAD